MVGNQWSVGKKQLAVGEPTFLANVATGNVGIGINTAGYKLQVHSAIPGVAIFETSSTGNTGNLAFFNGSNHNYGMMGVV